MPYRLYWGLTDCGEPPSTILYSFLAPLSLSLCLSSRFRRAFEYGTIIFDCWWEGGRSGGRMFYLRVMVIEMHRVTFTAFKYFESKTLSDLQEMVRNSYEIHNRPIVYRVIGLVGSVAVERVSLRQTFTKLPVVHG